MNLKDIDSEGQDNGKVVLVAAFRAMVLIDECNGDEFDSRDIIHRAGIGSGAYELSDFMLGILVGLVSYHHKRGAEFKRGWEVKK